MQGLPAILIFDDSYPASWFLFIKMLVICIKLRIIYSIGRMIFEWCGITTPILPIWNVAFKLGQFKCYIIMWCGNSCSVTYKSLSLHFNIIHLSKLHARIILASIIFQSSNDLISISNICCLKRIHILFDIVLIIQLIYLILRIRYLSSNWHLNLKLNYVTR